MFSEIKENRLERIKQSRNKEHLKEEIERAREEWERPWRRSRSPARRGSRGSVSPEGVLGILKERQGMRA